MTNNVDAMQVAQKLAMRIANLEIELAVAQSVNADLQEKLAELTTAGAEAKDNES